MQTEIDVDAHIRAQRAAGRVSTNGRLHGTAQLPQAPQLPWYRRIFQWEDLIVAGKEVRGIVLHPIIASAFLGVVVALGLAVRSELNWQHDQLVILATQKTEAEKAAKQEHDDRALQESADRAWREKMKDQMNSLERMVSQVSQPSTKRGRQ